MPKSLFTPLLLAACLGMAPAAAFAQSHRVSGDPVTIGTAQAYLEAYGDLDLQALAQLYAEDADFIDETSRIQPKPFIWEGRDAILAGIGEWRESVEHIEYELTSVFEAAHRVVFIGNVVTDLRGPGGRVRYRFPTVTIVTLTGGRVVEHRDYVDYKAAARVD